MGWLIFTILFIIVAVAAIWTAAVATSPDTKAVAGVIAGVAILAWVIVSIFSSLHTIGQRQVGIIYNFSGTITGKKDPGVVTTWPWQHVKRENVGIQREDFNLDDTNAAVSQDQQPIFAHLTINFHVEPNHVVDLFKRVGPNWKSILLDSRALQDFKEVTSQYTAAQITTQRQALRKDTKERLTSELAPYDVHVDDVFVANLGYTQSYRDAINAKNVQVQQALQAEAKVAQKKAEADQEVATAEGDRRAAIARAEGTAKANKLIAASITDKLINLKRVEALSNATTIYVPANWTAFGNLGK